MVEIPKHFHLKLTDLHLKRSQKAGAVSTQGEELGLREGQHDRPSIL